MVDMVMMMMMMVVVVMMMMILMMRAERLLWKPKVAFSRSHRPHPEIHCGAFVP